MPNRRDFLVKSLAGGLAQACLPDASWALTDKTHVPLIDLPLLADDATAVPLQVSVDHPMEPGHFVSSLEVTLETDPVPSKGRFHFTPANGRAWVAFQFRSGIGGVVKVVGECTRHGRFSGTREVRVVEGGCGTAPDKVARGHPGNPMIRLPRALRVGQVVEVRTKVDHNSYTGLVVRGEKFVRELPEYYIRQMLVFVDGRKVSEFEMTSAVSPNPLIRFPLRIGGSGALRIVFVNNEGLRWEAAHPLRPAG